MGLSPEEANSTQLIAGPRGGAFDAAFSRPGGPGQDDLQLRVPSVNRVGSRG